MKNHKRVVGVVCNLLSEKSLEGFIKKAYLNNMALCQMGASQVLNYVLSTDLKNAYPWVYLVVEYVHLQL